MCAKAKLRSEDDRILVKYKLHKKGARYNLLRGIDGDKPRSFKENEYRSWVNRKGDQFYRLDYQMEVEIPERIKALTKKLTDKFKPEDTLQEDYERYMSSILSYIGKEVCERYFLYKLDSVNRFITRDDLEHLNLLVAFDDAVNSFCTILLDVEDLQIVRRWDIKDLSIPDIKHKWISQTSRDFKTRLRNCPNSYFSVFGLCMKKSDNEHWKYLSEEYAKQISKEVDKLMSGQLRMGLFRMKEGK